MPEVIIAKNEEEYWEIIDSPNEDFYEYKDEKLSGFDSEKGWVEVTLFLERASDLKRFTTTYIRGGQGNRWTNYGDLEFREVVKRKYIKMPNEWGPVFDSFDESGGSTIEELKDFLENNYRTPKLL